MNKQHYPFKLQPLPYGYSDLEPYIDEETMKIHHNKHLGTYINNLNKVIEKCPRLQKLTLEELIINCNKFPVKFQNDIKNNAGGVYNHELYFESMMGRDSFKIEESKIKKGIERSFGSFEKFKEEFKRSALNIFGSGYNWLVGDLRGQLKIISTPNQNTPDISKLNSLLLIDVWEHAYYLKNQNRRNEYIDNWFNVICWNKVDERYLKLNNL